jgi:osmoprotectant transport system permease protein
MPLVASFLDTFGGAIELIFEPRQVTRAGAEVGGLAEFGAQLWTHVWISLLALAIATAIALPLGAWLGHRGAGELLAVAVGNAGRAIPELALIALMVAFIGTGVLNVTIALMILGLPPILTNAFVGVRQVDRATVEAARGMGMSELQILARIELPLAVPTIMGGVRTGAINIVATATIAPLAGVLTLGDYILSRGAVGEEGLIAAAILVALLALAFELVLAGLQRLLTPRGVDVPREVARAAA